MTKSTYAFDANFIFSSLLELDRARCIAFGICLFERALPGFFQFQIDTGHPGGGELRAALAQCWRVLEQGVFSDVPFTTTGTCEQLIPDSEKHTSAYTSAAIDAVNIACDLLTFLERDELKLLMDAVESRRDTIDLFIQNSGNLTNSDIGLEKEIAVHPLMQEELCFVYEDLTFLKAMGNHDAFVFTDTLRRVTQLDYCRLRLKF
jgi:uncharacterized protein YjaG (DUF416 family)